MSASDNPCTCDAVPLVVLVMCLPFVKSRLTAPVSFDVMFTACAAGALIKVTAAASPVPSSCRLPGFWTVAEHAGFCGAASCKP